MRDFHGIVGYMIAIGGAVSFVATAITCGENLVPTRGSTVQPRASWKIIVDSEGGTVLLEGDTLRLTCYGVDSLGRPLGALDSVRWFSDVAGLLGTEQTLVWKPPATGAHQITVRAWSLDAVDSARLTVKIVPFDSVDVCVTGVASEGIVWWRNGAISRFPEAIKPLRTIAAGGAFYLWEEPGWVEQPPEEVRYWRDTTKVVLASQPGHIVSLCVQRNGTVCALVWLENQTIPGRHSRFVVYRGLDTLLPPDTPFVPSYLECHDDSVGVWGVEYSLGVFKGFRLWSSGFYRTCLTLPGGDHAYPLPSAVRGVGRRLQNPVVLCDVEVAVEDQVLIRGWYWHNNDVGEPLRTSATTTDPWEFLGIRDCCFWSGDAYALVFRFRGWSGTQYLWKNGMVLTAIQDSVARGAALAVLHGRAIIAGAVRDSSGAYRPGYWRGNMRYFLDHGPYTNIRITSIALKER